MNRRYEGIIKSENRGNPKKQSGQMVSVSKNWFYSLANIVIGHQEARTSANMEWILFLQTINNNEAALAN